MKDYTMKERELLNEIYKDLFDIKIFLIGSRPEEKSVNEMKEDCFYDSMKMNLNLVEGVKNFTSELKEIIIGGRN